MKVTFIQSELVANNIKSYWFKPASRLRFIAGQAVELHNPHDNTDGQSSKRWFTISSSPLDQQFSITTRLPLHEKRSAYKHALESLAEGDELTISNPIGDFVLPKDSSIPLVFIAGGIGCTPYHSMLKYLQEKSEKRDIKLLYYAPANADFAFGTTFSNLGEKFIKRTDKKITARKILSLTRPPKNAYLYISGPEPMVERLQADLQSAGISKNLIVVDFFSGYEQI